MTEAFVVGSAPSHWVPNLEMYYLVALSYFPFPQTSQAWVCSAFSLPPDRSSATLFHEHFLNKHRQMGASFPPASALLSPTSISTLCRYH